MNISGTRAATSNGRGSSPHRVTPATGRAARSPTLRGRAFRCRWSPSRHPLDRCSPDPTRPNRRVGARKARSRGRTGDGPCLGGDQVTESYHDGGAPVGGPRGFTARQVRSLGPPFSGRFGSPILLDSSGSRSYRPPSPNRYRSYSDGSRLPRRGTIGLRNTGQESAAVTLLRRRSPLRMRLPSVEARATEASGVAHRER